MDTSTTGRYGDPAEDLELLRDRVGRFGLSGTALGTIAMAFHIPYLGEELAALVCVGFHVLGTATMGAVWAASRRATSTRLLRAVESGGTLLASLCFGLMTLAIARKHGGLDAFEASTTILLTTMLIAFARAAIVPSTSRWTVLLTSALFVAVLPAALLPAARSPGRVIGPLLAAGIWWLLTVVLAGIASSVIYGLRREIAKARAIGQYQLVEKIGEGGMGVVYRARHRMLRRETALKVLPPARHSPRAVARFEREVQLTAQLTHANTVTIYDYGRTPDGVFYYTMELLDGANLEDVVACTGPMPPARVARILTQVAAALGEAHGRGLVHRDVKPSNIMLCERGGEHDVAKVLDFGLVRESMSSLHASPHATAATEILGTPLYMSPEAIASPETVSSASDLYALGAVAVLLLTGKPLFAASTLVEICSHHLHSPPPRLAASDGGPVPDDLAQIVAACLAKRPEDRPASARALADALTRVAPSLGVWGETEAEAFWRENAPHIATHARTRLRASSGSMTLAVDVDRRMTASDQEGPATKALPVAAH